VLANLNQPLPSNNPANQGPVGRFEAPVPLGGGPVNFVGPPG